MRKAKNLGSFCKEIHVTACTPALCASGHVPSLRSEPQGAHSASERLAPSAAALRVLQQTALWLATTPGGLRFVPGSHPWLTHLTDVRHTGARTDSSFPSIRGLA